MTGETATRFPAMEPSRCGQCTLYHFLAEVTSFEDQPKENLFVFPEVKIRFSVLAKPLPFVLTERHLLFHCAASATFVPLLHRCDNHFVRPETCNYIGTTKSELVVYWVRMTLRRLVIFPAR